MLISSIIAILEIKMNNSMYKDKYFSSNNNNSWNSWDTSNQISPNSKCTNNNLASIMNNPGVLYRVRWSTTHLKWTRTIKVNGNCSNISTITIMTNNPMHLQLLLRIKTTIILFLLLLLTNLLTLQVIVRNLVVQLPEQMVDNRIQSSKTYRQ